jgi:hypothetical protein
MRTISEILTSKQIKSKELVILAYKGRYNYWLLKQKNMEEFIAEHAQEELEKYKKFFSNIIEKLDICQDSLELLLERKLSKKEQTQGFDLEI